MPSPTSRTPKVGSDRPDFGSSYFVRILVATFVFSAAINVLQLSMPLYSLQVFARAIPSENLDTVLMLTVLVVLALSMIALLETVRSRLLTRCANAMEMAWRRRLATDVLDSAGRGRPEPGPMNDLMEIKGAITRPTFGAMMDLPWTPLYVVGIYLIHPLLAAIMLVSMVILTALGYIGYLASKDLMDEAKGPAARSSRLFDAVQTQAPVIRGLRMGPAVLDTVSTGQFTHSALMGKNAERAASIHALTKWVRMLLQVACTGVGAWLVMEQHLSFGGMIATSMLVGRGMAAVEQLVGSWGPILKSVEAWKRLKPLLKRLSNERPRAATPMAPERLTAENVLFISPVDQKPILRSVVLTAEAGETVCILGANRAGKSVLARLLAGVQAPSSGSVRLGGQSLAMLNPQDPATGIGYLPQGSDLLPGTIAQNIARFTDADEAEVAAAAERAGIREWIESLPQGYESEAVNPVFPLAGTPARLIALARAGFGKPALVVLDEPAAGLDDAGIKAVRGFIEAMKKQGTTVVILSYMPVYADMADKTYVLQNGMLHDVQPRQEQQPNNAAAWARLRAVQAAPATAV
ncbi:MAG TPA: ATP-binding cassette domain-containing protein [Azospirillum sp.]|nr:ATP-binding cassette domain-containing protein [Azospirillum sp.]